MGRRLLVLCYHNVTRSWSSPYEDGAASFERQMRAARALGQVVPLGDAVRDLTEGRPLPARAVAVTFDDGYRDNLDVAVPVLERLGLPATFFLTTGLLDGSVRPWWEVLGDAWWQASTPSISWNGGTVPARGDGAAGGFAQVCNDLKTRSAAERESAVATLVDELGPPERRDPVELFLDWEGARELARRGFEIGSHTVSHPLLSRETPDEQRRQLSESKQRIEAELGIRVDLLAYPNGRLVDFDEGTEHVAAQSGYTHAFTCTFGWNQPSTPRYELRRVVIEPTDGLRSLVLPFRYALTSAIRSRLRRPASG